MSAIGGSIEAVDLSGREFAVTAEATGNRKLGGFENAVNSNGNGSARTTKTRVPWMLSGLDLEIDDTRGDQEYLQDLANRKDYFDVSVTLVSGVTYNGTGQIVEAIEFDTTNSTASLSLSGPGSLRIQ